MTLRFKNFSIKTIGGLSNDDGEGNENGKSSRFTTLHVHHAFLYISLPSSRDCDMTIPNFTRPLYGVGEYNTKILFFLL